MLFLFYLVITLFFFVAGFAFSINANLGIRWEQALNNPYLIGYAGVFLVSMLTVIASTLSLSYRLRHLKRAADRATAGELNSVFSTGGMGEVSALAKSFRKMLEKLQNDRHRSQGYIVDLERKIKDLKRLKKDFEKKHLESSSIYGVVSAGRFYTEPEKMYDYLLESLMNTFSFRWGALARIHWPGKKLQLKIVRQKNTDSHKFERLHSREEFFLPTSDEGAAKAIHTELPVVSKISGNFLFPQSSVLLEAEQALDAVYLPLVCRGRILGLAVLSCGTTENLTSDDLNFLQLLASRAAATMETAELSDFAVRDFHTGLFNQNYFLYCLDNEIERVSRNKKSTSLLVCDCEASHKDDKSVSYIADSIFHLARKTDIVGCLDSGRFALMMPFTDRQGAEAFAKKLCSAINEGLDETNSRIHFHIGFTNFCDDIVDAKALLGEAEDALEAAMQNGLAYKAWEKGKQAA